MRKGYLLTALAAAVLLAASSGTALAQGLSVSIEGSSGTLAENASGSPTTPPLLNLVIRRGGDLVEADGVTATEIGDLTLDLDHGPSGRRTSRATGKRRHCNAGLDGQQRRRLRRLSFTLSLKGSRTNARFPPQRAMMPTNWQDEKYVLRLTSDLNAVNDSGGRFTLTIDDDETQPVVSFGRNPVRLTEESSTTVAVTVDIPRGTRGRPSMALNALSRLRR